MQMAHIHIMATRVDVDIYVYGIFLSFDCPVATQVLTIGPVR